MSWRSLKSRRGGCVRRLEEGAYPDWWDNY